MSDFCEAFRPRTLCVNLGKKDRFMSRILTRGAWVRSQDCACGIFGDKRSGTGTFGRVALRLYGRTVL